MGERRMEGIASGSLVGERYRIVERIGEGGMGSVYLAEDLRLPGQRWALKWVPRDETDPLQPEKEAAIMTRLRHPALPRIVDYIPLAGDGGCCLVMDYLEGETLLQRSAAHDHRLPWTTVTHYAIQLCELLEYLHTLDSPVVFRDMKPSNVIVGSDDRLRLVDFGIARTYKPGKTQDTVHVGSVGFASPELLANRQTDHRSDLYSLGCLLYFLLSGGQFYNFTKAPLERVSEGVPETLCDAVRRLLAERPEDRFPDAKSAKAALRAREIDVGASGKPDGGSRRHYGGGAKRCVVAVFGLFPKAGATFVSVALAKALAERGVRVTFAEFPWSSGDPFLAMQAVAAGNGTVWREHTLTWKLRSEGDGSPYEPALLYKLLFEAKGDVVVVDVSSASDSEAVKALFRASDWVVAVAAPDPAGLRSAAAVDNWLLANASADRDRIEWIANRMPVGLKLPEFYTLFSKHPIASIQELCYEKMTEAKWSGRWLFDESEVKNEMLSWLNPLLRALGVEDTEPRGLRAAAKKWLANKWTSDYNKGN